MVCRRDMQRFWQALRNESSSLCSEGDRGMKENSSGVGCFPLGASMSLGIDK